MTFLKEQQEFATKWLEPKVTFADRRDERVAKFAEDILGAFWVEQQKDIETLIHQVIQNTRIDWLRSEIEKLEGELNNNRNEEKSFAFKQYGSAGQYACESALTSIIIRYKEELKVLESK